MTARLILQLVDARAASANDEIDLGPVWDLGGHRRRHGGGKSFRGDGAVGTGCRAEPLWKCCAALSCRRRGLARGSPHPHQRLR